MPANERVFFILVITLVVVLGATPAEVGGLILSAAMRKR